MPGDGGPVIIDASKPQAPLPMKEATIFFARGEPKFQIKLEEPQALFLTVRSSICGQVVVDDCGREMFEAPADRAGILELDFVPAAKPIGIRIRPLARATNKIALPNQSRLNQTGPRSIQTHGDPSSTPRD